MAELLELHDIDEFLAVRALPNAAITRAVLSSIAQLDEANELEPALRQIIYDPTETPHGPTEIADILSSHIHLRGTRRLAGFVLKGKSYRTVRSRDVTHQFAKLRTIPGLGVMIFAAVGHIQDDAQRDFVRSAIDANCDYLIMNAHECARLLLAYEKICAVDGTPFSEQGICRNGHGLDEGIALDMTAREKVRYTVASQKDVSHGGAKRYSANILLDRHYPQDVVRKIIRDATADLKHSSYYRNDLTRGRWGNKSAQVIWLFLGYDLEDITNANWVCRSCWIDPELPKEMQPVRLRGNDAVDDIELLWNEGYQVTKSFVDDHQRDKGRFLDDLEPLKCSMVALGAESVELFSSYEQAGITEEQMISKLGSMADRANELQSRFQELPLPPPES